MYKLPDQVVCQSKEDQVTVIGAGLTLHEALAAAEYLKKGKIMGKIYIYIFSRGQKGCQGGDICFL